MTRHFIPGKDDHYKFTRSEYAQLLGISSNALRMRMRRGQFGSEYVVKNGNYMFKRPRDFTVAETIHGQSALSPAVSTKKKYNRGATHRGEAKYTNDFFKRANEVKALNKIQRNLGDEYTNEINEEVIKIAHDRVIKKKEDQLKKANAAPLTAQEAVPFGVDTTSTKYGSILNASGLKAVDDKVHARLARRWKYENSGDYSPGSSMFFGNFGQSLRDQKDSVEIDTRDIPEDDSDPVFSSKIDESIWRLKNKK